MIAALAIGPWIVDWGQAAVLTEGTADCHMADIQRILPETEVRTL